MNKLYIILDHPQMAENIGIAIRAMVNCGVTNLRLVEPRCGWPNKTANLTSAEKSDIVKVELCDTVKSAISDLNIALATTARARDMIMKIYTPTSAAEYLTDYNDMNIGIVFGPESSGLSNENISLCNGIITIPSVNFPSYNLAQAVLIISYTLQGHFLNSNSATHLGKTKLATLSEIDHLVDFLSAELVQKRYFKDATRHKLMMQTLRNFFMHSSATTQEINSLFGAIKWLKK